MSPVRTARTARTPPLRWLIAAMTPIAICAALAPASSAAVTTQTLDDLGDSPWSDGSALGVDARGGAVAAWTRAITRSEELFVSVRRAGGRFGRRTALATGGHVPNGLTLAVGARGDAAVVWYDAGPNPVIANPNSVLRVNRRLPGGDFGPATVLPRTRGVEDASVAAIDGRGRLVVAWRQRAGRPGCGRVVMAITARRGAPFRAPRRISGVCPNAEDVRLAVGRGGVGAVAWRARAADGQAVEVSTFRDGRFAAPRTASPGRIQGAGGVAVAAGGGRVLLAWRDRPVRGSGRGAVVAASIDGGTIQPPVTVSTSAATRGSVGAAMNERGAAIVTWLQGPPGGERYLGPACVALRPAAGAPFGLPETVNPSVEFGSPLVAVGASGNGLALSGVAQRRLSGTWERVPGVPPSDTDVGIGTGDAGDAVFASLRSMIQGQSNLLRVTIVPRLGR